MNKAFAIMIIGLTVATAGGFFAYQKYQVQQASNPKVQEVPQVQEVKECSSCTARHKAYSKAKKSWAKTKEDND